jgi:hypothetical protein
VWAEIVGVLQDLCIEERDITEPGDGSRGCVRGTTGKTPPIEDLNLPTDRSFLALELGLELVHPGQSSARAGQGKAPAWSCDSSPSSPIAAGPYCVMAPEGVDLLRAHGLPARRLEDGLPEWRLAGYPVAVGLD